MRRTKAMALGIMMTLCILTMSACAPSDAATISLSTLPSMTSATVATKSTTKVSATTEATTITSAEDTAGSSTSSEVDSTIPADTQAKETSTPASAAVEGSLPATVALENPAVYAATEDGVIAYKDGTLTTVSRTLSSMMVVVITGTAGDYAVTQEGEYILMSNLILTTCSVS